MIQMILNRNPWEVLAGIFAMALAIRSGYWMYKKLIKSGYKEFKGEDEE